MYAILAIVAVGSALTATQAPTTSEDEKEILRTVAAAQTATIQMIHSYHAKLTQVTKSELTTGFTNASEYWRVGDAFRIHETTGSTKIVDIMFAHAKVHVMSKNLVTDPRDMDPRPVMIVGDKNRRTLDTDPWELSLFVMPNGIYMQKPLPVYTLDDLAGVGELTSAQWEMLDGRRVAHLVVNLPKEQRRYELWSDPQYNWCLSKVVHVVNLEPGVETWRLEYHVLQFTEAAKDLYVPSKVSLVGKYLAKSGYTTTAEISDIQVNDPRLQLPPMPSDKQSMVIIDENAGVTYSTDKSGRRVGPSHRLGGRFSPALALPKPPGRKEPRSLLGWLVITLSAGMIGWGFYLRRRRRLAGE